MRSHRTCQETVATGTLPRERTQARDAVRRGRGAASATGRGRTSFPDEDLPRPRGRGPRSTRRKLGARLSQHRALDLQQGVAGLAVHGRRRGRGCQVFVHLTAAAATAEQPQHALTVGMETNRLHGFPLPGDRPGLALLIHAAAQPQTGSSKGASEAGRGRGVPCRTAREGASSRGTSGSREPGGNASWGAMVARRGAKALSRRSSDRKAQALARVGTVAPQARSGIDRRAVAASAYGPGIALAR